MPFINVKTNVKISKENESSYKDNAWRGYCSYPRQKRKIPYALYGRKQNVVQRNRRALCYGKCMALGQANREGYDKNDK